VGSPHKPIYAALGSPRRPIFPAWGFSPSRPSFVAQCPTSHPVWQRWGPPIIHHGVPQETHFFYSLGVPPKPHFSSTASPNNPFFADWDPPRHLVSQRWVPREISFRSVRSPGDPSCGGGVPRELRFCSPDPPRYFPQPGAPQEEFFCR